jgi:hypothetical protein
MSKYYVARTTSSGCSIDSVDDEEIKCIWCDKVYPDIPRTTSPVAAGWHPVSKKSYVCGDCHIVSFVC